MKSRHVVVGIWAVGIATLTATVAACVGDEPATAGGDTGDGSSADGTTDGSSGDGSSPGDGGGGEGGLLNVPRQIAPLSTSRVTSRTPTLHWILPSGVTDATVDLCLDRACTKPIGTPAHVTGSSYKPATDLPVGVVFWRVHPSTETTASSATWQFTVGVGNAAIDTSWGTTLDVNGDGFGDAVIGDSNGNAFVFLGTATGLATTAATPLTIPAPAGAGFGLGSASAGDVNGDGYADLIVSASTGSGGTGNVFLYYGSATGLTSTPAVTIAAPSTFQFGSALASAGDVNGDGYADLVIGTGTEGRVYLYFGSASGIATLGDGGTAPSVTLADPVDASDEFGVSVASAGDINGDGFADIVVGASITSAANGAAYLYLGNTAGIGAAPSSTFAAPDVGGLYGETVAGAGDVNGDGLADFVIAAPSVATNTGHVFVYLGLADGGTLPDNTLVGPDGVNGHFGAGIASAGDVNNDGFADIVIGAPGLPASAAGKAYVFLGAKITRSTSAGTTLTGLDGTGGEFGSAVGGGGIRNSGYSDLIVGAKGASSKFGTVYVFNGTATGVSNSAVPSTTLNGHGANEFFGVDLFGATN